MTLTYKMSKLIFLFVATCLFSIQTAQASSTFSGNSTVTITIDSITNNTNAGDLSGLDIYGLFEIADSFSASGFGQAVTGDGNSYYSHTGGEIDSFTAPINAGDSFNQLFSANGSATAGNVDAYYQTFGGLEFINNTSDSFTIEYSLNYDLNASTSGDFAENTVAIEYFNDLGDIYGYQEASASTLLNLTGQNSSIELFSLSLAGFGSDMFYADVSATGYAEAVAVAPVPLPAAGWLMLSGLAFLRNYRKSVA